MDAPRKRPCPDQRDRLIAVATGEFAAALLDQSLQQHLGEIRNLSGDELVATRYKKFRNMAQFFRAED